MNEIYGEFKFLFKKHTIFVKKLLLTPVCRQSVNKEVRSILLIHEFLVWAK